MSKPYQDLEQQIKNAILRYISLYPLKGFAFPIYNGAVYDPYLKCFRKPGPYHRKGVPDISGIWCQRPLYIETKAPGQKPRPEQHEFLSLAKANGAISFWTDNV